MNKKIFLTIVSGFAVAVLATNTFAQAANLDQALATLPQNEEWSIMAYASMGQNVGSSFLAKPINSSVATDYEKRILAITATGANPATIGSENFVTKLESMFDGNQIGNATLVNDDIFGILALKSAGISDDVVSKSRFFVLSQQNSDGGYGFGTNTSSDSNTTAAAVAALAITGGAPSSAIDYLKNSQESSTGGYGFTTGDAADGASTAWVMWGLRAAGQSIPSNATSFLDSLQTSSGSFKWKPSDSSGSLLVTTYAVIALSGHTLPVNTVSDYQTPYATPYSYPTPYQTPYGYETPYDYPTPSYDYPTPYATPYATPYPTPYQTPATAGFHTTITYPGNKIFDSSATGSTVLDVLINATSQINLLFVTKQTSFGQFVSSIDGYAPVGTSGWQYAVNGIVPDKGAADYVLKAGDFVQWFYGPPSSKPY